MEAIGWAGVFVKSILLDMENMCTFEADGWRGIRVPMGSVCAGPLSIDWLTLESSARLDRDSHHCSTVFSWKRTGFVILYENENSVGEIVVAFHSCPNVLCLADPGKARGCFTNSVVIESLIHSVSEWVSLFLPWLFDTIKPKLFKVIHSILYLRHEIFVNQRNI